MSSHYRHQRTSDPTRVFPNPIEPGEIVTNTANRQIAVGDADAATIGTPLILLAVRYFDVRAKYAAGDFVVQGGTLYRAKAAINPGAFNAANWDAFSTTEQMVPKSGGTMTGLLILSGDPAVALGAATKQFVEAGDAAVTVAFQAGDNAVSASLGSYVAKAGGSMSGPLILSQDPTADLGAVTKQYVDAKPLGIAEAPNDAFAYGRKGLGWVKSVQVAGDVMTGDLNINKATPALNLQGQGDTQVQINWFRDGLQKWLMLTQMGATADFLIGRFNDAGAFLDVPLSIARADGRVSLLGDPTAALHAATKQYVDANAAPPASASDFLSNVFFKYLQPRTVWDAAVPYALGTVSSVTPNMNLGVDFTWTLNSATCTLTNPTNPKPGQKGIIYLTQDALGSRLITTWGSSWKFFGGSKPILSTVANATDTLSYAVKSPTEIHCAFMADMK